MRGYFGIGIYHPKSKDNVGTLWRSAYQLGAAFIFTIGKRYSKQASDTVKAYRHIPYFDLKTYEDFEKLTPFTAQKVFVEFNNVSKPITSFRHPESCVYLLGSEDGGFPKEIEEKMYGNSVIELPAVRTESFNVAVAGSIVMYDRLIKS